MNTLTATLKGAIKRSGYDGKSFAKIIGMKYPTLNYRYAHPQTWKFYEWAAVLRHLHFYDDELKDIRKEIEKL